MSPPTWRPAELSDRTLVLRAQDGDPTAALVVMAAWAVPGFVVASLLPRRAGARTHDDR